MTKLTVFPVDSMQLILIMPAYHAPTVFNVLQSYNFAASHPHEESVMKYDLNSVLPIVKGGCTAPDCMESCFDATTALSNSSSLWNCLMFMRLGYEWQRENVTVSGMQLASLYGFYNATSQDIDAVYRTVSHCLDGYRTSTRIPLPGPPSMPSWNFADICSGALDDWDPDIRGVGVGLLHEIPKDRANDGV